MPLLDHFHPPISDRRHWEAFHAQWASCIASALNETLPAGYFAEPQVHAGPRIEVDVASFAEQAGRGGLAVLPRSRPTLAPADLVLPAHFPPEFAVHVFDASAGPTLVAAVELVSPANKDRDESRRAFTAKCATYLQRGLGLIVVDVVTNRTWQPLPDLLVQLAPEQAAPTTTALTAVSYRPVRFEETDSLELRIRSLALGAELPELSLALGGVDVVPLDLEATYENACRRSRLP